MKKWITFSMILVLLLSLCLPVFAQQPRLVDDADLLTDAEEQTISEELDDISQRLEMDVVIVTVNSLEGETATAFADDYFDYNGYGMGTGRDGILFLISMEDRDWAISTSGSGIAAFTDNDQEYIMNGIMSDLSAGYYYDAFRGFISGCDDSYWQTGDEYPDDDDDSFPFFAYLLISAAIGFVVALIATGVMKGKLKSVRRQVAADNYLRQDSLQITEARDIFLYHTVTQRAKPKETSSTHVSSSGRTHGGSSGKF